LILIIVLTFEHIIFKNELNLGMIIDVSKMTMAFILSKKHDRTNYSIKNNKKVIFKCLLKVIA